jgi:Skp family chaperone for outer membrane proteins
MNSENANVEQIKEVNPEKVLEEIDRFWEAQTEFRNAINKYNEAATRLAELMGVSMREEQMARFPANMKIEDENLRKQLHDLTVARRAAAEQKGMPYEDKDLPPELL